MELTIIEQNRLQELESVIESGLRTFIDVGSALLEVRDSHLYRLAHGTFENYCKERWGMQRAHAYRLIDATQVSEALSPMGDIPKTERVVRPLVSLPPEQQREAWTRATQKAEVESRTVTAGDVRAEVYKLKPHVAQSGGENEWYTPEIYIIAAREVMGGIDCDPASSDLANKTVSANTFYTEADNGLTKKWNGNVWMNPPYSQPLIKHFCEAVIKKYKDGEILQACVLVNNATETGFFQDMMLVASAVCFPRGRIKFIDKQGNPSGAPLQGQAILYFGKDRESFFKCFSDFGVVFSQW